MDRVSHLMAQMDVTFEFRIRRIFALLFGIYTWLALIKTVTMAIMWL